MSKRTIEILLHPIRFTADHLKTQEMYNKAVEEDPWSLKDVPDHFKTQDMFIKTLEVDLYILRYVPDYLKTQKMCDEAVQNGLCTLKYVPDWFVTQQQLKLWDDDVYYCNDDYLIQWYEGYKKRKAQKASIKDELIPIAWHLLRWWDWCVPEDEKKRNKKIMGINIDFFCI